jgi:hypothetical protein
MLGITKERKFGPGKCGTSESRLLSQFIKRSSGIKLHTAHYSGSNNGHRKGVVDAYVRGNSRVCRKEDRVYKRHKSREKKGQRGYKRDGFIVDDDEPIEEYGNSDAYESEDSYDSDDSCESDDSYRSSE